MKRFLVTLMLTCVLSGSALAGTIPTCGAPEPAPTATQGSIAATVILAIMTIVRG
jgi:hypothetical protein